MKALKRNWQKAVAILLAVATFTVSLAFAPVDVQAAEKTYISEVFVSIADEEEDAKKYLEDEGYTILDTNLCEGMSLGAMYTAYYAYLGYKTTTDPQLAITDMAIMDMNGNYNYAKYESVLVQEKAATAQAVADLRVAINEFRANYAANQENALAAYELMNMYYEDDSGKKLGDFFLDASITDDQLVTLFMQASSYALPNIYQYLLAACGDGQPLMEKLEGEYLWNYVEDPQYSDVAREMADTIQDLITGLRKYEEKRDKLGLTDDSTTEEVEAALEEAEESESSRQDYLEYGAKYRILKDMPYGTESDGMTWLEAFLQEDTNDLEMELFYPIVAVMSEGQRAMAHYLTIDSVMFGSTATQETVETTKELLTDALEEYSATEEGAEALEEEGAQEAMETLTASVYAGVDRTLFDADGVALTNETMTQWGASGDSSWIYGNTSQRFEAMMLMIMGSVVGISLVTLTIGVVNLISDIDVFNAGARRILAYMATNPMFIATGVALGAVFILAAVYTGIEIYSYWHPEYKEIPRGMVNAVKDSDGDTSYIRYSATKQRVYEEGQDITSTYGNYADLNGWSGKQWNALYTTKDPNAGKPILADLLVQYNRITKNGYDGVHFFNHPEAYDINIHAYATEEETEMAYIFFQRDTAYNPDGVASVFAAADMILFSGLSAAAGVVVGGICMWLIGKRKKKSAASA